MSLKTVMAYAAQWGVSVRNWDEAKDSGHPSSAISQGPSLWSILNWETHPEILRMRTGKGNNGWPYLLHELAHVVCPHWPENLDELQYTTGFEILSILHLGLSMKTWERWQQDFGLDVYVGFHRILEWRDAPPVWRRCKLITACNRTREIGLFVKGTPTFKIERLAVDRAPSRL